MAIFQRRSNPPSYTDFQRYKPLLRADFSYRCAYCLLHEGDELAGGFHHFQIDHFRPKSHPAFKHLISNYSNLYYSCQWCNRAKWETWPSDSEKASGYEFVDPCKADLYLTHARLREDGKLESKTNAGEYSIGEIRLNRRMFIKLREAR